MDTLGNEQSVVLFCVVFVSNSHNVRVCTKANDVNSFSLPSTQNNKNHIFSTLLSFISSQGVVHESVGASLVAVDLCFGCAYLLGPDSLEDLGKCSSRQAIQDMGVGD